MTEDRIGIIGIGLLGSALADRLIEAGHAVVGFDVDRSKCDALKARGGAIRESADSLIRECDSVLLSLPTSKIVSDVLRDAEKSLRPNISIIDTTTGDPEEIEDLGNRLATLNIDYVEAKVAGSSDQTRRGDAVLLLAGNKDCVNRSQTLIDAVSPKSYYLGSVGAATRFKLVHNLVLGLHRAVLAEGLLFGQALGFDPALTLSILEGTPAASRVMQTKGQKMVSRDYAPQATLSQHLKDVRLIVKEADRLNAATPLSILHQSLLERAQSAGYGDADNSAIVEAFADSPPQGDS